MARTSLGPKYNHNVFYLGGSELSKMFAPRHSDQDTLEDCTLPVYVIIASLLFAIHSNVYFLWLLCDFILYLLSLQCLNQIALLFTLWLHLFFVRNAVFYVSMRCYQFDYIVYLLRYLFLICFQFVGCDSIFYFLELF